MSSGPEIPTVEARFHHRHLDVFSPGSPVFAGEKVHRAMADVLRSIQELHRWRAALGDL